MTSAVSQSKQELYSVDMLDHALSARGIDNFFWPVNHQEITRAATDFLYESSSILQKYDDADITAQIYKMAMKYYVAQFGGIFQAARVKQGFEFSAIEPDYKKDWLFYPYIFNNMPPPMPALIDKLKNPAAKQSVFKKFKNPARVFKILKKMSLSPQKMAIDGLKLKTLTDQVLANDIIATQRTPLIVEHAGKVTEDVVYAVSSRWFSNIGEEEFAAFAVNRDEEIEDKIAASVIDIFKNSNLVFAPYMDQHLREYLGAIFQALGVHYQRLLARQNLPKKLWTGTGGDIWDLLLRLAVIQKNGTVTGHDHGGGTGHVNIPVVGYIELWACHKFVTFNQKQAALLVSASEGWPLLDKRLPEVIGIKRDTKPRDSKDYQGQVADYPVKNILLLSTLYDRDRGRSFAFYPDIVYADWQARLAAHLKSWGHKVLFKPHPESQVAPHPDLTDNIGAEIINGYFSDIVNKADLIIFDYTYTTVFLEALKTDIPIVLIEFDNLPWHPGAKELLQKRCGFVEGRLDENNRVDVNWDSVQSAIEDSVSKRFNQELLREFFE